MRVKKYNSINSIMNESTSVKLCAVCKIPAVQQCAGCKSVYYCTREHQKRHWKDEHRNKCCVLKLKGDYLVAARDIKRDEVIVFNESPVVAAPQRSSNVVCLSCHKRIVEKDEERVYRCTNCNYPVCNSKCQEKEIHQLECKLMQEQNYKTDLKYTTHKIEDYNLFGVLRTLLQPRASTLIESCKQLINNTKQNEDFKFLTDTLKLPQSYDQIVQCSAQFDQKSLEFTCADICIRLLYPTVVRMKHDCKSNTKHVISTNYRLNLIATVPIAKGEFVTISHCEILWGTLSRRAYLQQTKKIECECERCRDNTELGTYLGSIFCSCCKKDSKETTGPKMLSTGPLNPSAEWKCEKCEHTIKGRQMNWGNDAIKTEMNHLGKSPLNLEQFLVKYKETLHPKNYHALVAKYTLNQIYGNQQGYGLTDLTDGILERKVDLCHELLEVIDVLAPGSTIIRGTLLYELQSAMVMQTKREYASEKITKSAAQETLGQCMILLKEATEILSTEYEMKEFLEEKLKQLSNELDF